LGIWVRCKKRIGITDARDQGRQDRGRRLMERKRSEKNFTKRWIQEALCNIASWLEFEMHKTHKRGEIGQTCLRCPQRKGKPTQTPNTTHSHLTHTSTSISFPPPDSSPKFNGPTRLLLLAYSLCLARFFALIANPPGPAPAPPLVLRIPAPP